MAEQNRPVAQEGESRCRVWEEGGNVFETYAYAPGPAEAFERHVHETWQFCLSLDFPGNYALKGGDIAVPAGSVTAIPPDVPHGTYDPHDRDRWSHYRVLYVPTASFASRRRTRYVSTDPRLAQCFLRAHRAHELADSRLEREAAVDSLLRLLRVSLADDWPDESTDKGPSSLLRVRERLLDRLYDPPSTDELAAIAGLDPSYLNRSFTRRFGLPPHRFLNAARLERAREMLRRGHSATFVAHTLGFTDPSHFNRRFRAAFGVTPGRYAREN